MAYDIDINHCRFSGVTRDIKQIQTRTGTPMASFKLQCWKEQVRCVGFKEVAGQMLAFRDGDRVELAGKIQSSNWEKEGVKVYSYQVIVEKIEEDTEKSHLKNEEREPVTRSQKPRQQKIPGSRPPGNRQQELSEFDYSGGPF